MDNFDLKQYLTEGKLNEGGGYRRYFAFLEADNNSENAYLLVDITNSDDEEMDIKEAFMSTFLPQLEADTEGEEREAVLSNIDVDEGLGIVEYYDEDTNDGMNIEFRFFELMS